MFQKEYSEIKLKLLDFFVAGCKEGSMWHEPGAGNQQHGAHWADTDAHTADTQGPPCQDICHALGFRLKVKGRKVVNLIVWFISFAACLLVVQYYY